MSILLMLTLLLIHCLLLKIMVGKDQTVRGTFVLCLMRNGVVILVIKWREGKRTKRTQKMNSDAVEIGDEEEEDSEEK